jgi:hypothetical protein
MEYRVMKTKLELGKSVKNLVFKSIRVSLLTSTHYLVSDSVNGSVYYLVDSSLTISTMWNIRL